MFCFTETFTLRPNVYLRSFETGWPTFLVNEVFTACATSFAERILRVKYIGLSFAVKIDFLVLCGLCNESPVTFTSLNMLACFVLLVVESLRLISSFDRCSLLFVVTTCFLI